METTTATVALPLLSPLPPGSPREEIRPPKFADKFAALDFAAQPMPVISMFPPPPPGQLEDLGIRIRGEDLKTRIVAGTELLQLPRVTIRAEMVCQIFNWYEPVDWTGVRLSDFLDAFGLETHSEGYYAFHSNDGEFFETISRDEARDPRTLLATGMGGQPMPHEYGGPMRLVVPFLQGYKSVKWVGRIEAFRHDPSGVKRLLAQSKTGRLGTAWLERLGIEPAVGKPGDPA